MRSIYLFVLALAVANFFLSCNQLAAQTGKTPSSEAPKKVSDAYETYARGLMKRYDENQDGYLSSDELKKMRRPPSNADVDVDGRITEDELARALRTRSIKGSPPKQAASQDNSSRENVSFQVDLLSISPDASLDEFVNLVNQFNGQPDNINKLADNIKNADGVTSVGSYLTMMTFEVPFEVYLRAMDANEPSKLTFYASPTEGKVRFNLNVQSAISNLDEFSVANSVPVNNRRTLFEGTNAKALEEFVDKVTDEIQLEQGRKPEIVIGEDLKGVTVSGHPDDVHKISKQLDRFIATVDRNGDNRIAARPPSSVLSTKLTTVCRYGGGCATLVSDQGHNWMILVRVKE